MTWEINITTTAEKNIKDILKIDKNLGIELLEIASSQSSVMQYQKLKREKLPIYRIKYKQYRIISLKSDNIKTVDILYVVKRNEKTYGKQNMKLYRNRAKYYMR